MHLHIHGFHPIWEVFGYISNILCAPFCLYFPSANLFMHMLVHTRWYPTGLLGSIDFSLFFSLSASLTIISTDLSLSLLFFLPLPQSTAKSSSEFFIYFYLVFYDFYLFTDILYLLNILLLVCFSSLSIFDNSLKIFVY